MIKDFVFKIKVDTADGQKELQQTITTLDGFDQRIKQLNEQIASSDFGTAGWKELNQELALTTTAKQIMIEEGQRLSTTLGSETDALMSNTTAQQQNTDATDLNAAATQRLDNETKKTTSGFERYQLQIRKARQGFQEAFASGDEKAMKKFRAEIDDLEDSLEIATLKSMKFGDAMASLPGIAGFVGQSIQGVEKGFKVLAANPLVAVLTALGALLTGLFTAFGKTEKGAQSFAKVGEFMQRIFNGLVAVLEPLFNWLADLFTAVTSNKQVMDALGAVVGGVAATFRGFYELLEFFILTLVDLYKLAFQVGKALGGLGDAVGKFFRGDWSGAADAAKNVFNTIGKLGGEFVDNVIERGKQGIQDVKNTYQSVSTAFVEGMSKPIKKSKEGAKKDAEDLNKILEDYLKQNESLKEKNREDELKAEEQQFLKLQEKFKGNQALLNKLEEAYRVRKDAINAKWNEIDSKKLQEQLDKNLSNLNAYLDKEAAAVEKSRKNRQTKAQLGLKQDFLDGKITQEEFGKATLQQNLQFAQEQEKQDEQTFKKRQAALIVSRAFGTISLKDYEEQSLALQSQYDQQKIDNANNITIATQAIQAKQIEDKKAQAEEEVRIEAASTEAQIGLKMGVLDAVSQISSILTSLAGENKGLAKAAVIVEQGVAIGRILTQSAADLAKVAGGVAANSAAFPLLAPKYAALGVKQAATIKIAAGIGIASAVAGAIKGISDIDKSDKEKKESQKSSAGGGMSGGVSVPRPQGFAEGGFVSGDGTSTSDSIPAFLSNGESVMTAEATAMFAPFLSMMNQAGGGRAFDVGSIKSSSALSPTQTEITPIKTYVVAQDMSTMQMFERSQMGRSTI